MIPLKEYHKPDIRWEIFNKPDFESYKSDYVVKGLFHSYVPQDIVDAYEVAEYMQAHAYYHYPLYDEAVSKILRITEMAVKLRCSQLGLDLEFQAKNKKSKQLEFRPHPLKTLMDDIINKEPNKQLDWDFKILRDLRNSYMHPSSHSYMGGGAYPFIQRTVTFFNKLFLPKSIFEEFDQNRSEIQDKLRSFANDVFILSSNEKRYLIENVTIEAAILIDNEWLYCLVCSPILNHVGDYIRDHRYSPSHSFFVKDVKIEAGLLRATHIVSSEVITIVNTSHPDDILKYKSFIDDKNASFELDRSMYEYSYKDDIAKQVNDFEYSWLYKVANR